MQLNSSLNIFLLIFYLSSMCAFVLVFNFVDFHEVTYYHHHFPVFNPEEV